MFFQVTAGDCQSAGKSSSWVQNRTFCTLLWTYFMLLSITLLHNLIYYQWFIQFHFAIADLCRRLDEKKLFTTESSQNDTLWMFFFSCNFNEAMMYLTHFFPHFVFQKPKIYIFYAFQLNDNTPKGIIYLSGDCKCFLTWVFLSQVWICKFKYSFQSVKQLIKY